MDLHLHLSVAFRALDKKWGNAIDLDSSTESFDFPCLPAVIERPTTTFSSEEFLKTRKIRSKPYTRYQESRKKQSKKSNDSFADISSSRIPEVTSMDSGLDQESTVSRLVEELTKSSSSQCDSWESLDSMLEDRKMDVLNKLKNTATAFIKKSKRKLKLGLMTSLPVKMHD